MTGGQTGGENGDDIFLGEEGEGGRFPLCLIEQPTTLWLTNDVRGGGWGGGGGKKKVFLGGRRSD